jgi:uncharacterized DUF497 family protein
VRIEFDPKKAASNLKKHGVSFEEAASCLLASPPALVKDDPREVRTAPDPAGNESGGKEVTSYA